MERGELREGELERELESLYRKVAGLDQPEDGHNRTVSRGDVQLPPHAGGQGVTRTGAGRQRGHRFPIRPYWGRALAFLFLTVLGLSWWQGWWGAAAPKALSTEEGGGGTIALAAEETVGHPMTLPPGESRRAIRRKPAPTPPPADRSARYAVQIRAYPEEQKQNALLFMEELRGRAPDVSLETVSIAERGVWHRILLGDFSTAEEAAEYRTANRVAREHPYGFIQRKYAGGPRPAPAPRNASAGLPAPP
ncbi:MAG: SPOR domain-containing protein [Syntrophales bacterium]